jgi:hypothetical protein
MKMTKEEARELVDLISSLISEKIAANSASCCDDSMAGCGIFPIEEEMIKLLSGEIKEGDHDDD